MAAPPPVAATAHTAPAPGAGKTAGQWVRDGIAHREGGRANEAEAAYNAAIKIERDQRDVWFNLGNLQLEAGRNAEALEQYDHALKLAPDDVDALINRAHALLELRKYEQAATGFQSVIDRIPGREDAWIGLGAVRHRLGDSAAALEAFERAHSLAPDDPRTRFNLGMQLSTPLMHQAAEAAQLDRSIGLLEAYVSAPLGDPRDTNAKKRLKALSAARKKLSR